MSLRRFSGSVSPRKAAVRSAVGMRPRTSRLSRRMNSASSAAGDAGTFASASRRSISRSIRAAGHFDDRRRLLVLRIEADDYGIALRQLLQILAFDRDEFDVGPIGQFELGGGGLFLIAAEGGDGERLAIVADFGDRADDRRR